MTDDALTAAAEAATPGPWCEYPVTTQATSPYTTSVADADNSQITAAMRHEDAAFIAAASPDVILGLLDRLAAVEADRDRLAERLAAVEALADEWVRAEDEANAYGPRDAFDGRDCAEMLRTALSALNEAER